jgi:cysteine-rich repeat protein
MNPELRLPQSGGFQPRTLEGRDYGARKKNMSLRKILSNKKLVIAGIGAIALLAAAVFGLTTAYFQDVEISAGNRFVAGDFDLLIDSQCSYNGQPQAFCTWLEKDLAGELFFNFGDVKPSDTGEDTISFHIIDNDAWLCAEIGNLVNQDNGCRKPEQVIGDTTCGNPGIGEGELQDNILFTVWKDTDCDNKLDPAIPGTPGTPGTDGYCDGPDPMCMNFMDPDMCMAEGEPFGCEWFEGNPGTPGTPGTPAEQVLVQDKPAKAGYWAIADSTTGSPIPGDTTICYGIYWKVPLAVSNIIQSDSVVGNLTFNAVQARGMNNFKCSDLYTEICDGIDNNYDGHIDEGFVDTDADGLADCVDADDDNDGAPDTVDCAILNPSIYPGAVEVCGNGIDENCNGEIDEGCMICGDGIIGSGETCDDGNTVSNDGCDSVCKTEKGWQCFSVPSICMPICGDGIIVGSEQCDDGNLNLGDGCDLKCNIMPGWQCSGQPSVCTPLCIPTTEICDGKDNDCDGSIDEGVINTYYRDADGDGYGTPLTTTQACLVPAGYATNSNDCNDSNAGTHPGATEITGNSLDEDCSGMVACYRDQDNDTYGSSTVIPNGYPASGGIALTICGVNNVDSLDDTTGDCDDNNASINPAATESCNGKDDDCDTSVDEGSAPSLCPFPPNVSLTACSAGVCTLGACFGGFANCDLNYSNGCEINVTSNISHCGSCFQPCSTNHVTASCVSGNCQGACNVGFANCNGNMRADGCEVNLYTDNSNCGACGHVCTSGYHCNTGGCVPNP